MIALPSVLDQLVPQASPVASSGEVFVNGVSQYPRIGLVGIVRIAVTDRADTPFAELDIVLELTIYMIMATPPAISMAT